MGDPAPLEIPDGFNLYHFTNTRLAAFIGQVSRFQVFLDEWEELPQEFKDRIRTEIQTASDQLTEFVEQLRAYTSSI